MLREIMTVLAGTAVVLGVVFSGGCESDAQSGALLGGAAGAGLGAIIGHQSGHSGTGALIGGAAGAGGGYLIGKSKDEKKASQSNYAPAGQTIVINIVNSNGSVTPVELRRSGTEYIGPKGEHYDHLPAAEELKPIYGL